MEQVDNGPGAVTLSAGDRAAAVAAVKARLNVALAEDDALIAAFAESALGLAEQFTGRVLIARAMTARMAATGLWQMLAAEPVRAVAQVTGEDGVSPAAEAYRVDIDAGGRGWVRAPAGARVRVTFTAGEGATWDAVPAAIREGAAMLAAHLYRDREGRAPVPAAVSALWRPYRAARLSEERRA